MPVKNYDEMVRGFGFVQVQGAAKKKWKEFSTIKGKIMIFVGEFGATKVDSEVALEVFLGETKGKVYLGDESKFPDVKRAFEKEETSN